MDNKKRESLQAFEERLKQRRGRAASQEQKTKKEVSAESAQPAAPQTTFQRLTKLPPGRQDPLKSDHPDIFDRMVLWGIKFRYVKWLGPVYTRYKEFLLYALFGLGTMLISINVYLTLTNKVGWSILISEAISWFFATLFAFFTNRKWVFTYAPKGVKAFFQQLVSFFFGRTLTLGLEEAILHIFVLGLGFPNTKVEYVAQIFIIAANYIFSKVVVFRRRTIARGHTRRFVKENDPDGYRNA